MAEPSLLVVENWHAALLTSERVQLTNVCYSFNLNKQKQIIEKKQLSLTRHNYNYRKNTMLCKCYIGTTRNRKVWVSEKESERQRETERKR